MHPHVFSAFFAPSCLSPGLHPLPFHVVNAALHAVVTGLVIILASRLLARVEQMTNPAVVTHPSCLPHGSPNGNGSFDSGGPLAGQAGGDGAAAVDGGSAHKAAAGAAAAQGEAGFGPRQRKGAEKAQPTAASTQQQQQPQETEKEKEKGERSRACVSSKVETSGILSLVGSWRVRVQAGLAGLLFALHPVHTEVCRPVALALWGRRWLPCACMRADVHACSWQAVPLAIRSLICVPASPGLRTFRSTS